MCPSGTYTNRTANTAASQCLQCPPGYYCPLPSVKTACPTGTASTGGATSQLQCACLPGYACDYSKFLEAVITLDIPASRFDYPEVRAAFIAAVAASAKVPTQNVIILKVEDMSTTPSRRLLADGERIRIHVFIGVQDADNLHRLDDHLRHNGLAASVDHGWYTPHEAKARQF
jgi:hypothetical protein